jgi:disulfide oxidoreductase YuzD
VERTTPDATLIIRAKVEAKTPTTTFKLVGIDVSTGPSTRYRDALSNLISADEFYALLQVSPAVPTMVRAQGVTSAVSMSTVDATRTNDTRGEVEVAQ